MRRGSFSSLLPISSAAVVLACVPASAAFTNWQEPVGGYDAVYLASENRRPDEAYVGSETNRPTFVNSGYGVTPPYAAPSASLVSSDGETVLLLNQPTTAGPNFNIVSTVAAASPPPAVGGLNGDDKITIDLRLRFPEANTLTRQFGIFVNRPAQPDVGATPATQQFIIWFDTTNGGNAIGLGNTWNDVRITIDQAEIQTSADLPNAVKVYLNDSSTPITYGAAAVQYTAATAVARRTAFGDFGSSADGKVELASFKITNSEIAAVVVPEPTALLTGSLLALMGFRRRR